MRTQATPNIYFALAMLALAWYTPSASALQDSDGSGIDHGLIPVTHTEVGRKMRRSVELGSVEDNTIQLATLSYAPRTHRAARASRGQPGTHWWVARYASKSTVPRGGDITSREEEPAQQTLFQGGRAAP
jgi:hypothetical protein